MKNKKNRKWIQPVIMLLIAGFMTTLAGTGLFDTMDLAAADAFYQSRSASDGEIMVVGIDQRAFQEIGHYNQWGRDVMAAAIEALNKSEECRPAAIAIDVLYAGETNEEADTKLAEAAGRYGNVAVGCAAEFGSDLVEDDAGGYHLDTFHINAFDEPYPALREAAKKGHINAMIDDDGILRHHLLEITLPNGEKVPSLALVAANLYQEYYGLEPIERPPVNGRGFWYVPFCGVPGDFYESISVADLISGAVSAENFAGKIVFIGPYATGMQDHYMTAADHAAPMYGVEFQANAVQAMLWGNYKQEVGDGIQLFLLFVILLAGLAGFWKNKLRVSTALWLFLGAGFLLFAKMMYERGYVLRILWIPAGVTILYVGCIAVNYIQAALEKRRVTNTFQRYVAPEIVSEILKEGSEALELGGRLTQIAVLFVDVRGFTPMSELLKPAQVVEILNRYLTLISDCILRNGGTLDKFVGDAAMAFWGAPLPQEDFVMNAVKAAAGMADGAKALCAELLEKYGREVSFGIGVHVGEAVVGNIGSPRRMDYTAIGDTVNTAARLEANAPGGTIYISRAVADALEGRIRTTSLGGTVKLKGKKEGFEVLVMEEIL